MFTLKVQYIFVIIYLIVKISSIVSEKHVHISTCDVRGQFWNGEAIVEFLCGRTDNENDIFNEDPKYIGHYLKTRIGTVQFKNCRLFDIQRKYGQEFVHLHTFNLSDVELERLQPKTFKGARKLKTLIASNNKISHISNHLLVDAAKLNSIDLSYNNIQVIDALAFEGANNLQTLNLSHNRVHQSGLRSISLPNLLILDLSFNEFGVLKAHTFAKLPNVQHLNLMQSNITSIEMETFWPMRNLTSLDLSENHLISVNFNLFFPRILSLRSLSLYHNQIAELYCVKRSTLLNFVVLDLRHNSFNCTYLRHFLDMINWERMQRPNATQSYDLRIGHLAGISCRTSISTGFPHSNYSSMVEYCPVNEMTTNTYIRATVFYMNTPFTLFFSCILLICFGVALALKRHRLKGTEMFSVAGWTLSTIQIVNQTNDE